MKKFSSCCLFAALLLSLAGCGTVETNNPFLTQYAIKRSNERIHYNDRVVSVNRAYKSPENTFLIHLMIQPHARQKSKKISILTDLQTILASHKKYYVTTRLGPSTIHPGWLDPWDTLGKQIEELPVEREAKRMKHPEYRATMTKTHAFGKGTKKGTIVMLSRAPLSFPTFSYNTPRYSITLSTPGRLGRKQREYLLLLPFTLPIDALLMYGIALGAG